MHYSLLILPSWHSVEEDTINMPVLKIIKTWLDQVRKFAPSSIPRSGFKILTVGHQEIHLTIILPAVPDVSGRNMQFRIVTNSS